VIYIDAREGLSADMVLAASVGLLPLDDAKDVLSTIARIASMFDTVFRWTDIEEDGEKGLALSYITRGPPPDSTSHDEAYSTLSRMSSELGSRGDIARRILDRIFEAESAAHELPPEQVHLHEIGRPQALLNIAGIGFVAPMISAPGEVFKCSTITTGRGVTVTSHGTMRIPAPAAAFLLKGLVHVPGDHPGERATPTGVAAVSVLATEHSDTQPTGPAARSVGFGTKRFAGRLGRIVMLRA
jgi:uncharacterized protein (DUF111 family)